MTQCERILEYMERHGSITAAEAWNLGIGRLASRICELRQSGKLIKSEIVCKRNADGERITFARYFRPTEGK